jgi:hypothetical protein
VAELPSFWVCGDTRVELFSGSAPQESPAPLWAWDSTTAPGLPDERRGWFTALDEVKPVVLDGVPHVLVTSSYLGGVALIRRDDQRAVFSLALKNAHSADLLPGGWIVVAGSVGSDKMVVQHVSAGVNAEGAVLEFPYHHAHGVVYQPEAQGLWFCGHQTVHAYDWKVVDGKPQCQERRRIELPDPWAHDLQPDRHRGGLIVTIGRTVLCVDTTTGALSPFAPLADFDNVKGTSVEAASSALLYIKAGSSDCWWSEHVHLILPDGAKKRFSLPGRRLYKVRWDQSCQLE